MRRLITTLAILFVVIVAGMTALVLLVNPNDFRNYMVQQVEQRSGYQLRLEGDLRWHVWPQLSILAGRMSVTAPGAQQPMVMAENMRLDVHLLPLLSHQLSVKQVMLKNAVIRLTPDSKARQPADAPVGPTDSTPPEPVKGWTFDINNLEVADSLLIWQPPQGEEINFRDLNLSLTQDSRREATLSLATRVSRDQRELQLSLDGEMSVADYPQRVNGTVKSLSWQLQGPGLPATGLQGKGSLQAEWLDDSQRFLLQNVALTLGDSQLNGVIRGKLGNAPTIDIDMRSPHLDLDALSGLNAQTTAAPAAPALTANSRPPVIAEPASYLDHPLNSLSAALKLQVDTLRWHGMDMQQVALDAQNQQGKIALNTLSGRVGAGSFSLPGSLNLRQQSVEVALRPALQNIALAPLLQAFALPPTLDGQLTLTGNLSGDGLSVEDFHQRWRGEAEVELASARIIGMNFQQLVQRAVARNSNRVSSGDETGNSNETRLDKLQAQATLKDGLIALKNLQGGASGFRLGGAGQIDMLRRQCDINFGVQVTSGWKGDNALIATLQQTAVPLHIYGGWDNLQYNLQVDQLLRQKLESEIKSRLDDWSQRNQKTAAPVKQAH
ncbi:outer membrane assembly protein AsmA [Mixta theicola]|uniref:Outer membrane assembly protein AsmA n=1 Tax=Mixta theicola TaxID=1458355 RepID=A0A2K1QAE5_9GAMM|nr:outer membrane assembly protein AsmA [Mixta theicola]PNS11995.1 outer membrane assembly protein AsmA [Mixta theicola]GLR10844.1 outer membrane assembly protein AsmA [Mixta theicola]